MILDRRFYQRIKHLVTVLVKLAVIVLHHAPESFSVIVGGAAHIMKIRSQHQSRRLIRLLFYLCLFCVMLCLILF